MRAVLFLLSLSSAAAMPWKMPQGGQLVRMAIEQGWEAPDGRYTG